MARILRPARLVLTGALLLSLLFPALPGARAAGSGEVKYSLSVLEGEDPGLRITVGFDLRKGERALLKPEVETGAGPDSGYAPQLEIEGAADPRYVVEPDASPGGGWLVNAAADGVVSVTYAVRFSSSNAVVRGSGARGGELPPRAVSVEGLNVFKGSHALLLPRRPGGAPVSTSFTVKLPLAAKEKALVPWRALDRDSFFVEGEKSLLENFIIWGELGTARSKAGDTVITTGYSSEVTITEAERRANDRAIVNIYEYIAGRIGDRPGSGEVAVLVCGASRFGLSSSAYEAGISSVPLFIRDGKLSGTGAAAAAGGLFSLWNRYSPVPRDGGKAAWFQEGMQAFYPLRVAAATGLMDSDRAFEEFSRLYRSYLADPMARSVSLVEAEERPGASALLRNKGAAVVASVGRRLREESKGSVKDIDWLMGRLAAGSGRLEVKEFTLVDISEAVEGATGKSWDRFFAGRVEGRQAVLASEFSRSDLFGSTSFTGGVVTGGGSGRNWIYLLIAMIAIFLIPVVFGPYVRRAVKLDLTMPKILPDDEED